MALRHQHGFRWLTRLQASAWPSVVAGATDPDMGIGNSLGLLDDTMILGDGTDHEDWHGLRGSMTLGHQHGYWLCLRSWASVALVAAWAMDINIDLDCSRTTDPDTTDLGSNLDTDVTMAPGRSTDHSDRHEFSGSVAFGHQ